MVAVWFFFSLVLSVEISLHGSKDGWKLLSLFFVCFSSGKRAEMNGLRQLPRLQQCDCSYILLAAIRLYIEYTHTLLTIALIRVVFHYNRIQSRTHNASVCYRSISLFCLTCSHRNKEVRRSIQYQTFFFFYLQHGSEHLSVC